MTQGPTYVSRALIQIAQFDYLNQLVLVGIKWIRGIVYVASGTLGYWTGRNI